MVEGDWELENKTGLEFYKGFDLDKHVADLQYDPTLPLVLSWDENVNPYLTCLVGQVKTIEGKNELRIIKEILGRHPLNSIEAVCQMVYDEFPPNNHEATVGLYGDTTSNKQDTKLERGFNFYRLIEGYLKKYRITNRVSKVNEGVSARGQFINSILEKETDGVTILIDRKCKQLISDLVLTKETPERGKLKVMATDPITKVRSQAVGHTSDAMDYMITGLFAGQMHKYKRSGTIGKITLGKPGGNRTSRNWRDTY